MSDSAPSFFIIVPTDLGKSCLAVPAVRAFLSGMGEEAITVGCASGLLPLWERECEQVVDLGKAVSPSKVSKVLEAYENAIVISFLAEDFRKYSGKVDNLFVLSKERVKALGTHIPFKNARGMFHEVEKYLSAAKLFKLETQERSFYPEKRVQEASGKILVQGRSSYGTAYYQGLESLKEFLAYSLEEKKDGCYHYTREHGAVALEKGETLILDKLPLGEVMKTLESVDLFLSPETELSHLAAYLGTPTVTIFGPGNPYLTRPLGTFHGVVFKKVECQPCIMAKCLLDHRCLSRVGKGQISEAVNAVLALQ